ncbi:MAG: CotH kinase family protein [Spirochaetales bacterium]|nr:CotH kinase family protein [Spirochaetales bacterium]
MKIPRAPFYLVFLLLLLLGCDLFIKETPEVEGVRNVYLSMSDDAVQFLKESNAYDGDYTHCYYEEDGITQNAWIKARGFSSRQAYKRSYTIMFEDSEGNETKYAFNACYYEPSCIRNRLAFETYQDLGIPAPEITASALFLNDEYLGYYDIVPLYDGEDLMDFYNADSLELYKAHFCEYEGNNAFGDEHPLQSLTEKKYPDDDDYEGLNSMIITFLELDDEEWYDWVEDNFDVEATASYCAAHKLLQAQETELFNHYLLIVDGLYTFLPWDNEQCLFDDYSENELGTLHKRLLQDGSPVKSRYDEIMAAFVDDSSAYSEYPQNLLDRVSEYLAQVDSAVYYDLFRAFDYDDFLEQEDYLINNINNRLDYIEANF